MDADAARAAARARVTVRLLESLAELQAADRLLRSVWGAGPEEPPLALDVMRALSHTGGYVAGAFDGVELVGVAAGFRTAHGDGLHSHVAGVVPGRHGQGIGRAMKTHQREWATALGLSEISWTYDPLVRRNAFFNLARLGAVATGYLTDFYGAMADEINRGDESDRLFVSWPVRPAATPAPAQVPEGAVSVLEVAADGTAAQRESAERVLTCATPPDIEGLRRTDPSAARGWRLALREVLAGSMDAGYRVAGITADGRYLLIRPDDRP